MKGLNVIFPDSSLQEEIIEQVMQHLHNSITNLTALPPLARVPVLPEKGCIRLMLPCHS